MYIEVVTRKFLLEISVEYKFSEFWEISYPIFNYEKVENVGEKAWYSSSFSIVMTEQHHQSKRLAPILYVIYHINVWISITSSHNSSKTLVYVRLYQVYPLYRDSQSSLANF